MGFGEIVIDNVKGHGIDNSDGSHIEVSLHSVPGGLTVATPIVYDTLTFYSNIFLDGGYWLNHPG